MLNIYNQQRSEVVSPSKKNTGQAVDFKKYNDATGEFGTKDLSYSFWYVKHRVLLYRLSLFSLIIVSAFLFLLSGVKWAVYIATIPQATKLESDMAKAQNYVAIQQKFSAQPLQTANVVTFPVGTNSFGVATEVLNPNDRFVVRFNYYYLIDGVATNKQETMLLPKQSTVLPQLGLAGQAGRAQIVIESPVWRRLSAHEYIDPEIFQKERLQFVTDKLQFVAAYGEGDLKVSRLTFNLINQSAYSFREPKFYVGLYNSGSLIGVLPLQFDVFAVQETKTVDLRYFVNNVEVQSVEVFPRIDVFNEDSYLPPAS